MQVHAWLSAHVPPADQAQRIKTTTPQPSERASTQPPPPAVSTVVTLAACHRSRQVRHPRPHPLPHLQAAMHPLPGYRTRRRRRACGSTRGAPRAPRRRCLLARPRGRGSGSPGRSQRWLVWPRQACSCARLVGQREAGKPTPTPASELRHELGLRRPDPIRCCSLLI